MLANESKDDDVLLRFKHQWSDSGELLLRYGTRRGDTNSVLRN